MKSKIFLKESIAVILLITVAVLSIFVIAKPAQSANTYKTTISSLDDKKMIAVGLAAAAAGASVGLALVPSDATTPVANIVADVGGYMLFVVGAVFLEKILVTLFGYLSFTYIIPAACVICILSIFIKKSSLRTLAVRLFILGLTIVCIIPLSVKVSDIIYENHRETVEQAVENTSTDIAENENIDKKGGIRGFINGLGEGVTSAAAKAERELSRFLDAAAILVITTCIIPIAVFLFVIWFIKFLFGRSFFPNNSYEDANADSLSG